MCRRFRRCLFSLSERPSTLKMEHVCAACKQRRSTSYHARHPLIHGKRPKPGVCSRCIRRFLNAKPGIRLESPVREIHHHHYHEEHHHYFHAIHQPNETTTAGPPLFRSELSAETRFQHHRWENTDTPPPVYPGTKPVLCRERGRPREGATALVNGIGTETVELHSQKFY